MHHPPPLPPELWEQIPPHVRAGVEVIIADQGQRIAALEAQVVSLQQQLRVLRERLSQNSQNSSKPPSSDGPHVKRKPPTEPSGRKPGGQPGHPGHRRALVPLEEVDEVVACLPSNCRRCGLRPVVQQARAYVQGQDSNIDETPWRERARRRWLWTVVTPQVSVFQIAPSRGAPVLQQLLGEGYGGVVTSDRAKAYDTRPLRARQVCWAHLRREFQAMIDRGGSAKATGEILLEHSNVLFAWWHRLREGMWARSTFQWYVGPLRQSFREELERGSRNRCPK